MGVAETIAKSEIRLRNEINKLSNAPPRPAAACLAPTGHIKVAAAPLGAPSRYSPHCLRQQPVGFILPEVFELFLNLPIKACTVWLSAPR